MNWLVLFWCAVGTMMVFVWLSIVESGRKFTFSVVLFCLAVASFLTVLS